MADTVEQLSLAYAPERRVYTVSGLTGELRALLSGAYPDIWVAGEISGAKLAPSGHFYFTLKDEEAQIQCVCYRMTARYLRFKPQDGVAVLARGRVDVYDQRGVYQLIVEALEPRGAGALQLAFEQLKRKLGDEGLFDAARKRALPALPRRIGIVTSPAGAALRDLLHVLERRFPGLHIRIYPSLVQGEGAAEQLARGIEFFSANPWADVVILARGGGSFEDLFCFNDERLARAIAASAVPVISAVGHETDFTIADFVADLRAPTPSAAAELVVPTAESLREREDLLVRKLRQGVRLTLAHLARRLHQLGVERAAGAVARRTARSLQRVDELDARLKTAIRGMLEARRRSWTAHAGRLAAGDVRVRFGQARRRLDAAAAALERHMSGRLAAARSGWRETAARLAPLSPLAVLDRGYAIVRSASGAVLKAPEETAPGEVLEVRLARGRLEVVVPEPERR
jgi:exodeoxyribonuclease VII large subunit